MHMHICTHFNRMSYAAAHSWEESPPQHTPPSAHSYSCTAGAQAGTTAPWAWMTALACTTIATVAASLPAPSLWWRRGCGARRGSSPHPIRQKSLCPPQRTGSRRRSGRSRRGQQRSVTRAGLVAPPRWDGRLRRCRVVPPPSSKQCLCHHSRRWDDMKGRSGYAEWRSAGRASPHASAAPWQTFYFLFSTCGPKKRT